MFKLNLPSNVSYLLNILEEDGYEAYIVGGCVRDSFLYKQPNDWDICTSAKPQEVIDLLECYDDIEVILTGLKHGTVTAHVNGENYEITTYRIDGEYSDNRRPDSVIFVDDIAKDLSRRDFTINAMAYNWYKGIVDPFGGYGDLDNKVIRCVGNPDDRFQEDALRILRALRFAATYGFEIDDETAGAIRRNKTLLKNISAERIREELTKMLCGKGAFDILMNYTDVMSVIIPELYPCIGFNQKNPYHRYDVYEHIAYAVSYYRGDDISIKIALLLHDIGKPQCYSEDENGVGHFYRHAVNSHRIAEDVMTRLRFDNKTRDEVLDLVLYHDTDIHPKFRSVRRWLYKLGPDMLKKLMTVRLYDIYAQSDLGQRSRIERIFKVGNIANEVVLNRECFRIKDLAVTGYDILSLGVKPGPKVGEILNHLLNKVIEEEFKNDHDVLIEEVKRYLKGE